MSLRTATGRLALVGLGLALAVTAACTPTGNCPTSDGAFELASCVAAAKVDGRQYVELLVDRPLPRALVGTPSSRGTALMCESGLSGRCSSVFPAPPPQVATLRIKGIPASEALLVDSGPANRRRLLVPADENYAEIISLSVQELLATYDERRPRGAGREPGGVTIDLSGAVPAQLPLLSGDRWGMPASIPALGAPLPSLLDDLPGRAVVAIAPDVSVLNAPMAGWARLRLLFYGTDGHWRRLDLGDLGLPAAATYTDSYGSGTLSPDGRWWAGPTRHGAVLVDLRTGQVRRAPLRGSPGTLRWDQTRRAVLTSRQATDRVVADGRALLADRQPHPDARHRLRPHRTVAVVATEPGTGRRLGALTYPRGQLTYADTWLDDETLLVATSPYLLAWQPARHRLYRVTDGRSLGDYWALSVVPR